MMPRRAAAAAGAAAGAGAGPATAPVSDVADPGVTVAVPHDDSVKFVAGRMRRGGVSGGSVRDGGSHFVCVVEDGGAAPRGRGRPRFVAVDNLEVLRAARDAGVERVGIRVVGCGRDGGGKGGGEAALREHLTRSSLHGTIDPFAAAEAVGRLQGRGGRGGGGDRATSKAHLGPYLERAVSLGFAARPRAALSDMVRRVYACGVRQAPPLPFLISVSRLDEKSQVAVADMTARLCEAVRQRHFAWPSADVIRLLLQGAGLDAGPDGARPDAGTARLPPTLRPAAAGINSSSSNSNSSSSSNSSGNSSSSRAEPGAGAGASDPRALQNNNNNNTSGGGAAATESRAARLSIFYCAGCEKRYCVLRGGVREVAEDRDGCYVVSPGPESEGAAADSDSGASLPPAEVIHALPSAQRDYLGLDDDSSLRVIRAGGAEALRKKADDLCRQGRDGPFVVLYAADRGRRPPGRGRKRRIAA